MPFDRIVTLGNAHGIPVVTALMGEPVNMHDTMAERRWWEDMDRFKEATQVQVREQLAADPL